MLPARAADIENVFLSVEPPRPVPPLVFEDETGAQQALADYRGKFVLLNVWATWCPPCAQEMPALDALQAHFDTRRLIVIPLSENSGDGIVSAFYRRRNIKNLPIAIDAAQRAPAALSLRGLPASLLIDASGNEVARAEGNIDWQSQKTLLFIHHKMGDN